MPLLVYFGHHKAGSRWIELVLGDIAAATGLRFASVCNPAWIGYDVQAFADARGLDMIAYTNAEPRYISQLRDYLGFHVIRDPRDMAVSAHFSHLSSHPTDYWPELVQHREVLRGLPESEGLIADMRFTARLPTDGYDLRPYEAMANWDYTSAAIQEMRFEALTRDPSLGFRAVLSHLRLDVPDAIVEETLTRYSFAALSGGRSPGQEDRSAHYRRGVPGDWRRHFGAQHREEFSRLHGDLVAQLGYPDWSSEEGAGTATIAPYLSSSWSTRTAAR
jgi:Sulfotransferase domain